MSYNFNVSSVLLRISLLICNRVSHLWLLFACVCGEGGWLLKDYRGVAVNTSDIKWAQWHYDRNNRECLTIHDLFGILITQCIKKTYSGRPGSWQGGEAASVEMNDTRPHLILHEHTNMRVKEWQIHGLMSVVRCKAACIDWVLKGDGLKSLLWVSRAFVTSSEIGLQDHKHTQNTCTEGFFTY